MKIAILGAGSTGTYVASVLSQEAHDVTVIDRDADALAELNRQADVATVVGSGVDEHLLSGLVETKPDLFFAATGEDAVNLTACALVKNLSNCRTAARIKTLGSSPSKSLDLGRLFYVDHFIAAEQMAARDVLKKITHSGDVAFAHFAHGAVLMRTIQAPVSWTHSGVPIKELKLPENLVVGLVRRNDAVLFPHGDDFILPGDEVTFVGEAEGMHELDRFFSVEKKRVKSVVLIGGSSVALHLARFLLAHHVAVRLIEKNAGRCLELADLLPEATVIHRDGKDPALYHEEQIDQTEALVACTDDDGTNLLIASMGKHLGCRKVIALVHDPAHMPLFEKAGIEPAMSARVTVANRLLALLHEKSILSVTSLSGGIAQIVELKISAGSKKAGVRLADLRGHLPKDLVVAAIENQGTVTVGRGHSMLCPDDTVIAICSPHRIETLHELFE